MKNKFTCVERDSKGLSVWMLVGQPNGILIAQNPVTVQMEQLVM
jgi:hypothetical protein